MRLEPLLQLVTTDLSGRDALEERDCLVFLRGGIDSPRATVAGDELEKGDVADYRASLSRIARFSLMNRSSLSWNARSARFAATCSVIA
jgi:hypothetical protein